MKTKKTIVELVARIVFMKEQFEQELNLEEKYMLMHKVRTMNSALDIVKENLSQKETEKYRCIWNGITIQEISLNKDDCFNLGIPYFE